VLAAVNFGEAFDADVDWWNIAGSKEQGAGNKP
jgi:hypothetical protein